MSTRKLSVHTEHEFLQKMEDAGLGPAEAQAVVESKSNELGRKVVVFIQRGGYEPTISQRQAKEIMGKNFLGIEEVTQHLGVQFTEKELVQLREIPFTEGVLQECKDTHILVAGYPLSIIDVREKASDLFYHQDWYDNEEFAKKEKVDLRWYLVKKDIVPDSINKTYQEQTTLISDKEEVPKACEMVYLIILYYLAKNVRLFEHLYSRCQNFSSVGDRVPVGCFGSHGFHVDHHWGGNRRDALGLSSARKVQS